MSSTERSRLHRARTREAASSQDAGDAVAEPVASAQCDVAEPVAPVPAPLVERPAWRVVAPAERPRPDIITLAMALVLATGSAGYSITGMTAVFIGAFWPVVAMGVALGAGKLRAVALLGMGRGSRRVPPRISRSRAGGL